MADFHVVHASHERCPKASERFHVAAIDTADSALDSRNWSVIEVLHAMGRGDRFYVERPDSDEPLQVRCVICSGCLETHTLETVAGMATEPDLFNSAIRPS
jgi:hypothetical protein